MVPVAVRPGTEPTNKASQKALPVPPPGAPGLQGSIDLLSCGARLPCSLVECGSSPSAAHTKSAPGLVDDTNNALTYWPEPIIPILPTSNFCLLPAVTVSVIVTATARCRARCLSCYRFQGCHCQDCNVGPSSSCAATASNLHVPGLPAPSHSYSAPFACPLSAVRPPASLVFAAHLCVPNSCAPKKEHKRVGRAHSSSINTLTAYIYLSVCEPVVSLAGVERAPFDTVTARRLVTARAST